MPFLDHDYTDLTYLIGTVQQEVDALRDRAYLIRHDLSTKQHVLAGHVDDLEQRTRRLRCYLEERDQHA
ncbi:hypothetical protein [Haloglycomyces albus]|uniref:hypothetical protein n=1 Tax=Haloglycomyces albus TaxID=526067 RepID=UPI00046CFEA8|nr:hypothetical protein [Haloglycomyces albus]